jgi:hypothetical protein
MRSILAALACLALFASCSPRGSAKEELQAVPVTIALLEESGRRCDELGRLVAERWQASASLTFTPQETQGFVGSIVRQAGAKTTVGLALLRQEAEIRIAGLETRRDPKAPLLRAYLQETGEHCSAVTAPSTGSLAAYAKDLELKQADRDLALEEAKEGTALPSVEGNRQITAIYNRIAAVQHPSPAPSPASERVALPRISGVAPTHGKPPTPISKSEQERFVAALESAAQDERVKAAQTFLYLRAWSCRRDGKFILVHGTVAASDFGPMELGRTIVLLMDAKGEPIETREGLFDNPHLGPSEATRFSFKVTDSPKAQKCNLSFTDNKGKELRLVGNGDQEEDL